MKTMVFSSASHIKELMGWAYERELTFPQIFKDSRDNIAPVLVQSGDKAVIVVGAFDAAAHMAAARNVPFVTFGRYFDWNQGTDFKSKSFVEAVLSAAGGNELAVEAVMPVGRYEALAAATPVSMFGVDDDCRVHVYGKSRVELEALWRQTRDADVPRLTPFVSSLRFAERLVAAMSDEPLGFAVLDRLADNAGFTAIMISAAFDLEMFTGLPYREIEDLGLVAIYKPRANDIILISRQPINRGDFIERGIHGSLAQAVGRHAVGDIGFQRDNLTIGAYEKLAGRGLVLKDATAVVRRFFDERAGTDLLYFITAANAVLAGIDHAKAFLARTADARRLTELDVAAVFHQGVQNFAERVGMAGRVFPYFDIIHPGSRTLLPAMAGNYPISAADETIKFDMGLLVTDSTGVVRGCSDIARSISPDPKLQAAHDKLRALLVDELIPAIRPGMSGGEIHAIGVEILRPMTEELKACGLLRSEMTMDGYSRDCGHTLQRQTLATVHFLPNYAEKVHSGMLGCTEFVWPIDGKIIACEDGYYVTPDGAIPFTI